MPDELALVAFRREADAADWDAIDDAVMGGRSRSRLVLTPNRTGLFSGEVSAENDGGFASVRSRARRLDLEGRDGLRLRVLSDGKRYKFCVKNDAGFDGVVHQCFFQPPAGEWTTIDLPFDRFVPTLRGAVVGASGSLDRSRIMTLGLMISDRQVGPFRLEVAFISAYRAPRAGP